jgi:hypothetical protein
MMECALFPGCGLRFLLLLHVVFGLLGPRLALSAYGDMNPRRWARVYTLTTSTVPFGVNAG